MFRAEWAGIATDDAKSPRTIIFLIAVPLCILDTNILYFIFGVRPSFLMAVM
jgi:hypothetical protein